MDWQAWLRLSGLLTLSALTAAPATEAHALTGGSAASAGTYSFVVKLRVGDRRSCTGALVHPRLVLTAASCFAEASGKSSASDTTVIVGRDDQSTGDGRSFSVIDVIAHPTRNAALAVLAAPVKDPRIAPIALGTAAQPSETLRVAGYGRTQREWVPDRLQTANFTVSKVSGGTLDLVGQDEASATTCMGDSGGPAIRERDGKRWLVAIHHTSWQTGCYGASPSEKRRVTTETRVDGLESWIAQQTPNETWCVDHNTLCKGSSDPRGSLDEIEVKSDGSGIRIRGWTFDQDAVYASNAVYLRVDDGADPASEPVPAREPRPDVQQAFGAGANHGFEAVVPYTRGGVHKVCVYAMNVPDSDANEELLLGCKLLRLPSAFGKLESATMTSKGIHVKGWVVDGDAPWSSSSVQITVDGKSFDAVSAQANRPDLAKAMPGVTAWHGFDRTVPVRSLGTHRVCVTGINVPNSDGRDQEVDCLTFIANQQ